MIDKYGREVTVTEENGKRTYSIDGLSLTFSADWPESRALDSINAMAPEGWSPPEPPKPSNEEIMAQIQALLAQMSNG